MKTKKFLKSRSGVALPLITIVVGLFALGFIALIVDAGRLYVERKAMITAADAAALAGAQVLRDSYGTKVGGEDGAVAIARNYAIENGADPSQVQVYAGNKTITIPSGASETRQVVEVTVGKNQQLTFARFLGDENTDVKARAAATWGYVYKTYIGEFIPLFIFDTQYNLDSNILLHDNVEDSNGYGFIDIGAGMGAIKAALAGNTTGGIYIEDNMLDGEAGQGDALRLGVEARMRSAQLKPTAEERRKTMIGLVPVIDREKFLAIAGNAGGSASQWQLPIKYFAYFEITDVIKKHNSVGSVEALNPVNEYKKVSIPFNYTSTLPGGSSQYTFVLGKFTGETVDARTIVTVGDQVNPNSTGDPAATYSKLIK